MTHGRIEAIVGIFTIIGLTLAGFVVFFVSDVYFLRQGYELNVKFNYVSILDKGAPVRMAGVRVGEVKEVGLAYEEKTQTPAVTVTLFVSPAVIVRENTAIVIRGTTPLSEPHVEIVSRGLEDGVPLKYGETIRGVDPVPIEQLVSTANEIGERFLNVVVHLEDFVEDEEITRAIDKTVLNLAKLTDSFNAILEGEEANIRDTMIHMNKAVGSLEDILSRIQAGEGTAGKIFLEEELYNEILAFVKDLRKHPWKLLAKPKEKRGKMLGIF